MDQIKCNLEEIKRLLSEVLSPTPSSPYINSDEIDENDTKITCALDITNKILEQL